MSGKDKLRRKIGGRKSTRQMYADQRSHQPVALEGLRLDGGTQPRESFDETVLREYAERMELDDRGLVVDPQGQPWEPIVLYEDEDTLWLADGFHRVRAARAKGIERFQARVIVGGKRDAIKYSLSANARHGLRRSSADKRRAVQRALVDGEWGAYSARAVAELCSVSDFLVRQVRASLQDEGALAEQAERVGADGKVHDVSTRAKPASKAARPTSAATLSARCAKRLGASRVAIEHLDSQPELAAVDCLIATPRTRVHVGALQDHVARQLAQGGSLVVVLDQESEAFAGIAGLLDHAALEPARWVVLDGPRQLALVWSPTPCPAWVRDLDALIAKLKPSSARVLSPS